MAAFFAAASLASFPSSQRTRWALSKINESTDKNYLTCLQIHFLVTFLSGGPSCGVRIFDDLAVGQREESQAGWLAARLVRMLWRPTST